MKNLLLTLFGSSLVIGLQGQCTLGNLASFYCSSDTNSYTLSPSCTGGSPTILGAGINGTSFSPALAGTDSIPIIVYSGTTTYQVSQNGSFDLESTTGSTSVTLGDDEVSGLLNLGFTFRFFDNTYTQFRISSNGFVTFNGDLDNGCCSGDPIPQSATPNNIIAAAWNDLYPPGSGASVRYQTVGNAPYRRCLVTFTNVPQCCGTSYPRTFQIKMFEGCGRIEIHTLSQPNNYSNSTQGIENSNGTTAYYVTGRSSAIWSVDSDYVAFQPNCGDTFWTFVSGGPDISLSDDTVACFDDLDGELTAAATGESPFSYSWSNSATTSTISNLSPGTYEVTITDDNGCSATAEAEVHSPDPISTVESITDEVCEGDESGSIHLSVAGGVGPYTYMWANGSTADSLVGLENGSYSVTVTDAEGCTSEYTYGVGFENAMPNIDLGNDRILCPNQQIVLVAPPGLQSYQWSTGSTSNSIVVGTAGQYVLNAVANSGCSGSDTIQVTSVIPVQVNLGPNQSGVAPILLDAGPNFTSYLWNTGSTSQSISVTIPGDYRITVLDTNSCQSRDTVNVKIWATGIAEGSEAGQFTIFPNPASDWVDIASAGYSGNATVYLVDLMGREVLQQIVVNSTAIRLSVASLAEGQYTLRIVTERGLFEQGIIITR